MKNWLRRWRKLTALSGRDKWLLGRALGCVILIKLALKLLPFPWFKRVYNWLLDTRQRYVYDNAYLQKVAWSVEAVGNALPFAVVCLPRALVFKYLLRHDPHLALKIGVSTAQNVFSAHAWVENDTGILIGQTPQNQYTPVWTWT
jgi:Transglutaminase-like superfamily